ncbi:secreted RxLR effector protein 161-like [Henckelia pumila]|uniref:secreted RxLR effector protein 161-like n=1 Tax=Henckelia pumila TaxID=405737 RepID=UPI003C6E51B4
MEATSGVVGAELGRTYEFDYELRDDMLIAGSCMEEIDNLNKELSKEFAMKDLRAAKQIHGIRILRDRDHAYMNKVPYISVVGRLMYAMVCTRPDIEYAMGVVSKFMSNPVKQHWESVKWIFRYLKGSISSSLCFRKSNSGLQGFVDANMSGDIDDIKSTTGYVFTFGGTAVSWVSKLQKIVALSTTEAEYVALTEARKEIILLR